MSGPANQPPTITARLPAEVGWALTQPVPLGRLAQNGITPAVKSQAEFVAFLRGQVDTMGAAVAAMNLNVN